MVLPIVKSASLTGRPRLLIHRKGIYFVLEREDLDNKGKSLAIRRLWLDTKIPDELLQRVKTAYAELVAEAEFVALRSSGLKNTCTKLTWSGARYAASLSA